MARGCPFTCSFCSQWKFWRDYRVRDPKAVSSTRSRTAGRGPRRRLLSSSRTRNPPSTARSSSEFLRGADRPRSARQGQMGHQHPRHRYHARQGVLLPLYRKCGPGPCQPRHRGGGPAQARPLQQGDQGRREQGARSGCCARPISSPRRSSSSGWRTRPRRRWRRPIASPAIGTPISPTGRCTRPGRSRRCSRSWATRSRSIDFEKYNFVTPIMKPEAMDRATLLDRVMANYRRFYMNKAFFHYPWRGRGFRRRYLLGMSEGVPQGRVPADLLRSRQGRLLGAAIEEIRRFPFRRQPRDRPAQLADWEAAADRTRRAKERQAAVRAQMKAAKACGGSEEQMAEADG